MPVRKIRNFDALARGNLRKAALEIAEAGLWAIDTAKVVKGGIRLKDNTLVVGERTIPLSLEGRLLVVGIGKCALQACGALEEVLRDRITDGIVLDVREGRLRKLKTYAGDHPFPTERNRKANQAIIELLKNANESDAVLFVVSGGGSTLLCNPHHATCEDEAQLVRYLFKAGATIQELNTIRKHLSIARGGFLAQYAYPARVISLIFSDVPGNDMEFIASGPTIKDSTSKEDAKAILRKYEVPEKSGIASLELLETPKDDKYFEKVENILFVSNQTALEAMMQKAKEPGFAATIRTATLAGEAKDVAETILRELRSAAPHSALLYGGETTVTIRRPGKGGRNLELALSGLRFIQEGELLMSLASDGRDNTDFAGGICDMITREKADQKKLDVASYLEENHSYQFFSDVGEFVLTGSTGSNVSDLIIAIKE